MLWFNFIIGLNLVFLWFNSLSFIHVHVTLMDVAKSLLSVKITKESLLPGQIAKENKGIGEFLQMQLSKKAGLTNRKSLFIFFFIATCTLYIPA